MTHPHFERIRVLAAAASPGPWAVERLEDGTPCIATSRSDGGRLVLRVESDPAPLPDVEFVALARDLIPKLVDALADEDSERVDHRSISRIAEVIPLITPGPWTAFLESEQPIGGCSVIWLGNDRDLYVWLENRIAPDADIDFIASTRSDLPELLAAHEAARK